LPSNSVSSGRKDDNIPVSSTVATVEVVGKEPNEAINASVNSPLEDCRDVLSAKSLSEVIGVTPRPLSKAKGIFDLPSNTVSSGRKDDDIPVSSTVATVEVVGSEPNEAIKSSVNIPPEDCRDVPLVDDSVTLSQSIQPIGDTFKEKRKRLPKKAKAVVPLQNERILRSASVKENPPKKPQLIDKQKKPVINVDQIDNPPPSSDVKEALFQFPPGISAEDKLELLLSSPYVNEEYSKQHLVAMFVDDEKDDYPLLYVDIRRYQGNGWMSNHFVSAYFYLLRKRFNHKKVQFLDTSFWTNYIMEPHSSDTVTQRAWVAKVKRVLNTYNISDLDAIYIPALVNENHFILLYIYVREREIKVFDPLGLRNDAAIDTLVNLLTANGVSVIVLEH
jgi:Ulp1 family protease